MLCSENGERCLCLMLGCLAGEVSWEPGEAGELRVKSTGGALTKHQSHHQAGGGL